LEETAPPLRKTRLAFPELAEGYGGVRRVRRRRRPSLL
jgi:hypothetical protein